MLADDLPWPELGNVSRGATRGNQGQKGVLSPPDPEGRCVLQLRVQPGVLAVRLNRQASDWYRILDGEVNRALKLTKTYWRKARRRQDYDARADQDHMELHEWLQQLKDKTMSHLELLMQKGDIQGPPYVMPDDIELTFLRKFIERQASGIPHNPRLRRAVENAQLLRRTSVDSATSDTLVDTNSYGITLGKTRTLPNTSHSALAMRDTESLMQEVYACRQAVQAARERFSRAQKDTQEAFATYSRYLEAERQARQDVATAEQLRDDIMQHLLARNQAQGEGSRRSPLSDDQQNAPRYHSDDLAAHLQGLRHSSDPIHTSSRPASKSTDWGTERPELYSPDALPRLDAATPKDMHIHDARKHMRSWERNGLQDGQGDIEAIGDLPPRKRVHQMMGGFDVFHNLALPPHNLPLPS